MSTPKDTRIDLRVTNSQKDFLNHAATLQNMKLSNFILDSALKEAQNFVANKTHFLVSEKQWKAFCKVLDRPAREIPELKRLFAEPDIFDAKEE
jgi:uncharacterized protein (DUF1778 family)